jgi:hypothetical protein
MILGLLIYPRERRKIVHRFGKRFKTPEISLRMVCHTEPSTVNYRQGKLVHRAIKPTPNALSLVGTKTE